METQNSRKLAGLFFFACAVFIGFCVYQIVGTDPSAHAWSKDTAAATVRDRPALVQPKGDAVSMQVDQAVMIGSSKIVFRGSGDGQVHFDHYLVDFNPHYAFKYTIPVDEARDGFRIGTRAYRVTHVGGRWVHFKVVEAASRG